MGVNFNKSKWLTGADPGFSVEGRQPSLGGSDLQHRRLLAKPYVKMKELGSVWGGGAGNFCM